MDRNKELFNKYFENWSDGTNQAEIQYNLNISEDGVFYCPDGYGNAYVVWEENKAYARRKT